MSNFVKNPPFLTACIISFLFGAIGTLAFSPFDYWIIAFVSAFGLIWSATLSQRKTALWATFAWSIGYFAIGVNWIHVSMIQFGGVPVVISYLAVLLLACYLSLYNLLFTWGVHKFKLKNPFVLASLFTGTEYLRGIVLTGFPWLQLGYSQVNSPFAHIAPIFGVEGVTFFIIVIATYLVQFILQENRKIKQLATFALLIAVGFATHFANFWQIDAEKQPLTVSLVQGDIEQKMKWDPTHFDYSVQTYVDLIRPLLGKSEVIILPESAIPALEKQISPLLSSMQNAAMESQSDIIIGTLYQDNQNQLFNSALLLNEQPYDAEQAPRYKKHHLVPFGEYVPLESILRPLNSVFNLPMSAFQSGDAIQSSLMAKKRAFSPAICYEIIFGEQVRQNLKQDTDYLLTISNDAWFGDSIGPWQHLQMARMRALELGKPLIRATNTGISVFVDAQGKVLAQAPQFIETTLTHKIAPAEGKTPYSVLGNMPLYALSLLFLVLHGMIAFVRRKMNLSQKR